MEALDTKQVYEIWDPIEASGDYGTITFASHTVASKAEFIRVPQVEEAKLTDMQKQMKTAAPSPVMKYIMSQWFEDAPKLMLRVIGTVDETVPNCDLMLDKIMQLTFRAASSAQGWVVTCGNEHDMAAVVGNAFDKLRSTISAPLIGVNAWSTIERREQLLRDPRGKPLKGKGVRRTYRDPKPDDILETRPLCPFNTHFVFFGGADFDAENAAPSEFDPEMIRQRTERTYRSPW